MVTLLVTFRYPFHSGVLIFIFGDMCGVLVTLVVFLNLLLAKSATASAREPGTYRRRRLCIHYGSKYIIIYDS